MNLFKRINLLFRSRTLEEMIPGYKDDSAKCRSSEQEYNVMLDFIEKGVQPWMTELEADRVKRALSSMALLVLYGDTRLKEQEFMNDIRATDVLKSVDLGE